MYKRYSIKRALLFIFIIVVLTTVFRVSATLAYSSTENETLRSIFENTALLTFIMHLTCLIIPCFIYIYVVIPKGEVKETLRLNKFSFLNLVYVLVLLFLFQPFISLVSYVSSLFFANVSAELLVDTMSMPYILSLLFIAVLPAFSEELVFRGILLSNCDDDHNLAYSMLNGLFFGILHGNFSQFFYAFFLGMLFYYIVKISNTIYLVMIAHFLINGSQVTLMYLIDMIDPAILAEATEVSQSTGFNLTILITLIIFTAIGLSLFVLVWKNFEKYNLYSKNYNPQITDFQV